MTSANVRLIASVSPLVLDGSSDFREPLRPPSLRDKEFEDAFDYKTVAYDLVSSRDSTKIIGPPLLNLKAKFENASWVANHRNLKVKLSDIDRTQSSEISVSLAEGTEVTVIGDTFSLRSRVSPSGEHLFRDKRVLFTKSKDNELVWISDWVKYYVETHGVNSVLLYDNGSTAYSLTDLLRALEHPALDTIVVVDWPFKFGPQGSDLSREIPWDSDFCEYGILEHARWRFLSEAEFVINNDIDELLIVDCNKTVRQLLDHSTDGAVRYVGRWIENRRIKPSDGTPRFVDFAYYNFFAQVTTPKWIVDPRRCRGAIQWKTHRIDGVKMYHTPYAMHRHFRGISTNWKTDRTGTNSKKRLSDRIDVELIRACSNVFGNTDQRRIVPGEDLLSFLGKVPVAVRCVKLAIARNMLDWKDRRHCRSKRYPARSYR